MPHLHRMDQISNSDAILPSDTDKESDTAGDDSSYDESPDWIPDNPPAAILSRRLEANRIATTNQNTAIREEKESCIYSVGRRYEGPLWFQRHSGCLVKSYPDQPDKRFASLQTQEALSTKFFVAIPRGRLLDRALPSWLDSSSTSNRRISFHHLLCTCGTGSTHSLHTGGRKIHHGIYLSSTEPPWKIVLPDVSKMEQSGADDTRNHSLQYVSLML